jgi:hypothetical protein
MDSASWLAYFRENQHRSTPPLPSRVDDLPDWTRAPIVASLQRFQIGETGEGTIARQIAEDRDPAIDDAIVECVRLWIREEGRHARELHDMLVALDAKPLSRDVSQWLFKTARRALGVRTKLSTIFVAEVVGLVFYGLVKDRVPSVAVAGLARALHDDESAHLDFLIALMKRMIDGRSGAVRVALGAQLFVTTGAVLAGALVTLALDQRATLAVLQSNGLSFAVACIGEIARRARDPRPPPAPRSELTSVATFAA